MSLETKELKWLAPGYKGGEGGQKDTVFCDIYQGEKLITGGYGIYFDKADALVKAHNLAIDEMARRLSKALEPVTAEPNQDYD